MLFPKCTVIPRAGYGHDGYCRDGVIIIHGTSSSRSLGFSRYERSLSHIRSNRTPYASGVHDCDHVKVASFFIPDLISESGNRFSQYAIYGENEGIFPLASSISEEDDPPAKWWGTWDARYFEVELRALSSYAGVGANYPYECIFFTFYDAGGHYKRAYLMPLSGITAGNYAYDHFRVINAYVHTLLPDASREAEFGGRRPRGSIRSDLQYTPLRRDLKHELSQALVACDSNYHIEDWETICFRAYDKLFSFQGNGIAYADDLKNLKSSVHNMIQLLKGKPSPKSFASLYLSIHYGLRLFLRDTRDVLNITLSPPEHIGATSYGKSRNIRHIRRFSFRSRVQNDIGSKFFNFVAQMDLWPTPENLWDMVPFSFVVDWFTGLGDYLHKVEVVDFLQFYQCSEICQSEKIVYNTPYVPVDGGYVTFHVTTYNRSYRNSLPTQFSGPSFSCPANHWVEGSALIIQRLSR